MRKFIVIVVASLVPVGMWTAGCRQQNSRQAAFPKTAEMKSLAKAPESSSPTSPPVIPAAPIDRDILNLPESPAMARVNAVNDRSHQIAKPREPEGLFTLPEGGDYFAMAAPAGYEVQAAPAAITPVPSAREFWSRPAAPVRRRSLDVSSDISAMAAPAPVDTVMAPPAPYLAPMPPAPAGQYLPIQDVPGLFDGSPLSMQSGGPPAGYGRFDGLSRDGGAHGAAPLSSNRRSFDERGEARSGPLRLDLAGLVGSSPEYAPVTEGRAVSVPAIDRSIVVRSIPGDYEPLPEPIPLDEYYASLGREAPRVEFVPVSTSAQVAGSVRTPLPGFDVEAVSGGGTAGKKRSSAPIKFPAMQAPALPKESYDGVSVSRKGDGGAALVSSDMRQALEPLPDIANMARTPVRDGAGAKKAVPVSMPPPMPEAMPTPEVAAAKSVLMSLEGLDEAEGVRGGGVSDRDFFRTDFWERKGNGGGSDFDLELPEPRVPVRSMVKGEVKAGAARPAEVTSRKVSGKGRAAKAVEKRDEDFAGMSPGMPLWVDEIPEEREVVSPVLAEVLAGGDGVVEARGSAPRRVKLQPMRKVRDDEMGRIDSSTDVPPLRF